MITTLTLSKHSCFFLKNHLLKCLKELVINLARKIKQQEVQLFEVLLMILL